MTQSRIQKILIDGRILALETMLAGGVMEADFIAAGAIKILNTSDDLDIEQKRRLQMLATAANGSQKPQ